MLSEAQRVLSQYIDQMAQLVGNLTMHGYAYRNGYDFLRQHGQWYAPPSTISPFRGAPKCCFANALWAGVMYEWTYVEGMALITLPSGGFFPVEHAWNLDLEGWVQDVTWPDPGAAYLGVNFALGRAEEAGFEGDACVLNDYRRQYPILRYRWTGEHEGYRESSRLTRMRRLIATGDFDGALALYTE